MHSYVVVAAKPGRSIPRDVLDLLDRPAPAELAFVPDDHVRWIADSGRLAYGGWQNLTHLNHIGSHWHVTDLGATAFSGQMWPHGSMWASGRSWAQDLDQRWRSAPVDKTGQPFDGIFSMALLGRDGTGEIITDPLSLAMIYRAESNDVVAFATRPGLAARAVTSPGREPERDPLGTGWMIFGGYLVGDRTGYSKVRALPIGSYVELHPRFGSRVRTANPTPWVNPDGLPDDPRALVDLVHQDLLSRVESVTKLPGRQPHKADITGGRDSRLILALLVEAGLTDKFRFSTMGAPDAPDAVVGRELAELCGLDFDPIVPQPARQSMFLQRLQIHAFQTSGMINAWDLQGGTGIESTTTLSGLFGEPMKTYFNWRTSIETSEDLLDRYLRNTEVDVLGVLRPEVSEHYRRCIAEELVERYDSESGLPVDRLDTFYVRNRLRRWGGAIEEIGHTRRTFPLYSLVALQAGFMLGGGRRRDEYLHFHIMRDACPMLAEHRFAHRGWRDSLLADVTDNDRYRAEPCTQPARRAGTAARRSWQADRFDRHRDLIEAYLLNEPGSALCDIVDPAAVVKALDGDLAPGPHSRYQMFGALTAAVWLGHHELACPVGTPTAELPSATPPPVAAAVRPAHSDGSEDRGVTSSSRGTRPVRRLGRRAPTPIRRAVKTGLSKVHAVVRRARRRVASQWPARP